MVTAQSPLKCREETHAAYLATDRLAASVTSSA